ncbi:lipid droplet-associated hydrolase [Galleria mellonella]|uniref:Lipid droplet-associated hydrolase n=1 Tax=Galleria mellonella TaxID=7137 RepID=A0ABM3N667_GALME|nr:lipid droplet-associated hydrolase [Galleria mellonella]
MSFKTVCRTLNYVRTPLLMWENINDCKGSDVVVCITGNPGIIDFYTEFGSEVHKNTGLPVCVIGQAGHDEPPSGPEEKLESSDNLYNLKGQVAQKLDLINNHIDKKSKIHLIGHSIGAWLIIELLEKDPNLISRVSSVTLLFPTLQKMVESPNGKQFVKYVKTFHSLIIMLLTLLNYLPVLVKTLLVDIYLKSNSLPSHYSDRILKCLNPNTMDKVIYLAIDEMQTVTTLNKSAIDRIKHLTCVIYSNRDNWAPIEYFDDFIRFKPSIEMKLVNINHAFVLKSSNRVAEMVVDFIKTKMYLTN